MEIKIKTEYEVVARKNINISFENSQRIIDRVLTSLKQIAPVKLKHLDEWIKDEIDDVFNYTGEYDEEIIGEDYKNLNDYFEYTVEIENIDEIVEYIKSLIPEKWIDSGYTVAIIQSEPITVTNSIFKNNEEEENFKKATREEQENFILDRIDIKEHNIRIFNNE